MANSLNSFRKVASRLVAVGALGATLGGCMNGGSISTMGGNAQLPPDQPANSEVTGTIQYYYPSYHVVARHPSVNGRSVGCGPLVPGGADQHYYFTVGEVLEPATGRILLAKVDVVPRTSLITEKGLQCALAEAAANFSMEGVAKAKQIGTAPKSHYYMPYPRQPRQSDYPAYENNVNNPYYGRPNRSYVPGRRF